MIGFRFYFAILDNFKNGPKFVLRIRHILKHKDRYNELYKYRYERKIFRSIQKSSRITTEAYGKENLPEEGGYVMFPNHQGKYDVLGICLSHDKPCTFVMDKAKSYGFFIREMVDLIGGKRLDINDVRQNITIINQIADEVAAGRRYILFSEGGYNTNGNKVQAFKPGSFKCATKVKAPIVPVALIDSYLPFNSNKLGNITTKVIFLKPITYDEYCNMNTTEIANLVRNRIMDKMREFGVDPE